MALALYCLEPAVLRLVMLIMNVVLLQVNPIVDGTRYAVSRPSKMSGLHISEHSPHFAGVLSEV